MEIKKAGLVVGVLVVMCSLQNVKAQNNTTTLMSMPTTTVQAANNMTVPMQNGTAMTTSSSSMSTTSSMNESSTTMTLSMPTSTAMTTSSSSMSTTSSMTESSTTMTTTTTISSAPITESSTTVYTPQTTPSPTPTSMVVSSSSVVVTPPPPTTPPTTPSPPPSVNVRVEINFNESEFDNAVNGSSPDGMRLREKLCHLITELLMNNSINLLSCNVTEVKPVSGGVVVVYELVFKATSEMDAEEVRNAVKVIKDAVKSGKIGEYAVNPDHPVNEKLIEPAVTIPPVSKNIIKVNLKIKFENDVFDGAVNDDFEGKALKLKLKIIIKENRKRILVVIIIAVRKVNSVEVEYDLVVNATSRDQAQEVIDAIQNQIKTGKIGNYTVDPDYPIGAKITLQVDGTPEKEPSIDPTTLIVLLAVGLFLLLLVIILLVVLIVKLRNKD